MGVLNSLVKYGGKELAKKAIGNEIVGATSDAATKVASSALSKILVKQIPSVAQKISVSSPEMITLYRGINAETPELLQKYLKDMKDNSILPRTYSGNALNGNGYTHSTDLATAREYANDGILNGKPYGAVTKIEVPKNRFLKMTYENGKSENNFIENAALRGATNAEEIGKQNFHNALTKNGIYGSHNLENQYTIMNNDAMRGMSTIEKYANGDLLTDTTPVSSYAIFDGKNLKRISNKTPSGNPGFLSKKIKIADNQASLLDYTPPKDLPVRKKEVLPTDGLKGGKTTEFNEKMKNVFGKTQFEYITGKKKPTIDDMLAALPEDKYPNTRERLKEVDKLSKSPYFSSREITNRYKNVMNGVYPSYIAEKEFGTEFKNLPIEYKKRLIYLTQENTANMSIQGDNYMGNLDKQLSEDLGIGRSNTIMTEGVGGLKSALGVYRPGPKDIGIERGIGDTRGKSVMAHERLHAFQHAEDGDYAPEVINAVDELKKDLEHSGAYNSMDYYRNINTLNAQQKTYYNKHIEQQSRMFQQYLRDKFNNNNGYTNHNPFKYETKQEYEFDPEKINPIFDKFIDRLRELSKAGYALPAILGIAVASKYLPKKEDKKS